MNEWMNEQCNSLVAILSTHQWDKIVDCVLVDADSNSVFTQSRRDCAEIVKSSNASWLIHRLCVRLTRRPVQRLCTRLNNLSEHSKRSPKQLVVQNPSYHIHGSYTFTDRKFLDFPRPSKTFFRRSSRSPPTFRSRDKLQYGIWNAKYFGISLVIVFQ